MKNIRELPESEKRFLHTVLTGMLISVAGVAQHIEMAEMAGMLIDGHPINVRIMNTKALVTFLLVSLLVNYSAKQGIMRIEVEAVLERSDSLPPTVLKYVDAHRYHDVSYQVELNTTYTM